MDMRIIDYYNILAAILCCALTLAALWLYKQRSSGKLPDKRGLEFLQDIDLTRLLFAAGVVFIISGSMMRLFRQTYLPLGLHQDEANIGYEAYILSEFGIDRDGEPWPIYPTTYGSGGGSPLMIYMNVLTTKLFGSSNLTLRRTCSVPGALTVALFALYALYLYKSEGKNRSVRYFFIASVVFALLPWHIILSRWSLDSNTMPFWQMIALFLLLAAVRKQKTVWWCLAAAAHAICLYAYGSANIIIPLELLIILGFCLKTGKLKPLQLIPSGIVFAAVALPLFWFYAVNYFGMPEIRTPYFTIGHFTNNRLGNVFIFSDEKAASLFIRNIGILFQNLTYGWQDGTFYNVIEGYATLYRFTFPFTLLGLALTVREVLDKDNPEREEKFVMLGAFLASALFSLMVNPSINRLVMLYIPMAFFLVKGLVFILRCDRRIFAAVFILFIIGAASFSRDYFRRYDYTDEEWLAFMPGYQDACLYAKSLDKGGKIWHTKENVTTLFLVALYTCKTDPYLYMDTVYYDPRPLEFRDALSFDNFCFYLPDDVLSGSWDPEDYRDDVFIMNTYQEYQFDPEIYEYKEFERYAVITMKDEAVK